MRLAAGIVLCSAILSAQSFDRTKPPEPSAPRPYKLPPVFETRLPNGLTVVLVEDTRVPLVTVRLAFRCGSRRDPKDLPGLAAAVADLMTQATSTRGSIQIVEAVDSRGGSLSATSGVDHITVNGSIEADRLASLLEIMADVAKNAEFADIDLRLYRQNRKQTLGRQLAQSSFVASQVFRQALFGDHPYAHAGPAFASLDKLTREALIGYRDRWLAPNNGFLILVGKIPARADTLKLIADRFGPWQQKPLPETGPESLPKSARKLILIDRPGAEQVDVRVGKIGATQRDPDYFAEWAGALILAGRASDVRIEHPAFDEAGIVAATVQVRREGAGEAIQSLLEQLARMASEPVTAQELADAKNFASGSFMLQLETQAGLADELMVGRIQGLASNYLELWTNGLESVGAEQVQAAAKRFLSPQDSVVVVVGDAAKIGPSLEKIGKFEVVKAGQ